MRGLKRPYSCVIQEEEAHSMNVKAKTVVAYMRPDALMAPSSVKSVPAIRSGPTETMETIEVARMLSMTYLSPACLTFLFSFSWLSPGFTALMEK